MLQISGKSTATTYPLFSISAIRHIEEVAMACLPAHELMKRAGRSLSRLTLALAPHSRCIWVACGTGNNGGDGFEAALQLHQAGKKVVLTCTAKVAGKTLSSDAAAAYERFISSGLVVAAQPPDDFDFCIDALLGLGASQEVQREGVPEMVSCLRRMHASRVPRLCVDLPSGLDADTGQSAIQQLLNTAEKENLSRHEPRSRSINPESIADHAEEASAPAVFTLSFLALKPGLFTAMGRDCAGEVWLDDLGIADLPGLAGLTSQPTQLEARNNADAPAPARDNPLTLCARLLGDSGGRSGMRAMAAHASHKGTFGDVGVIGGECTASSHMAGAALLAASAALYAGAGRVFVALLSEHAAAAPTVDINQLELMFRNIDALDLTQQVIVCGCGGGNLVKSVLPNVLSQARRLVLDADALNAIAKDPALKDLLKLRQQRDFATVLTPHPLEAARLLALSTAQVQADRLGAASQLAVLFGCTVILKGSGSIVAAPGQTSAVNPTGNALLATAGTGDVLAGMLGACIASGKTALDAACQAVYQHGKLADAWARHRAHEPMTASDLARFRC